MIIVHYTGISNNKASGVSVVVPQIMETQLSFAKVCCYNYGDSNLSLNPDILLINKKQNDNFETFVFPYNRPDLVIIHSPFGIPKVTKIVKQCVKCKVPYIIVPHGCFTKRSLRKKYIKKNLAIRFYFSYMLKQCSNVQFLSKGELESSIYNKKGIIIPNGININHENPLIVEEKNIISFIGRKDIYYKGIDYLLYSLDKAKEILKERNIIVNLYGPSDNNQSEKIKKMINKLGLSDFVNNLGPIYDDEKTNVFQKSLALVLTSRSEGFPVILLEAWANACPTLVTPGTNVFDEVNQYNIGWCAELDVEDIAKQLLEICMDRKSTKIKGDNAFNYVQKRYSWIAIGEKMKKTYEEIVEKYDKNI